LLQAVFLQLAESADTANLAGDDELDEVSLAEEPTGIMLKDEKGGQKIRSRWPLHLARLAMLLLVAEVVMHQAELSQAARSFLPNEKIGQMHRMEQQHKEKILNKMQAAAGKTLIRLVTKSSICKYCPAGKYHYCPTSILLGCHMPHLTMIAAVSLTL
jgi:hypothetical protein